MDIFLADENIIFSAAICFMLMALLLEIVSSGVISGLLDGMIPDIEVPDVDVEVPDVDIEVPDVDVDADVSTGEGAHVPALSKLFVWAKSKVPMLVYFIIFLAAFSTTGLITQFYIKKGFGHYLPSFIIGPIAFFLAIFFARYVSKGLSKVIFKDETTAVSSESFIGHLATITTGTAKRGLQAEARLKDKHNQNHYVYVEPDEDGAEFKAGEEVLLIKMEKDGTFRCIEDELNTN